jgi:hypothetical protein
MSSTNAQYYKNSLSQKMKLYTFSGTVSPYIAFFQLGLYEYLLKSVLLMQPLIVFLVNFAYIVCLKYN